MKRSSLIFLIIASVFVFHADSAEAKSFVEQVVHTVTNPGEVISDEAKRIAEDAKKAAEAATKALADAAEATRKAIADVAEAATKALADAAEATRKAIADAAEATRKALADAAEVARKAADIAKAAVEVAKVALTQTVEALRQTVKVTLSAGINVVVAPIEWAGGQIVRSVTCNRYADAVTGGGAEKICEQAKNLTNDANCKLGSPGVNPFSYCPNNGGVSGITDNVNDTCPTPPCIPTPEIVPSNLQAKAISSTRIDLTWQDNAGGNYVFYIQRRQAGESDWSNLHGADPLNRKFGTSYSNFNLTPRTTYEYRVGIGFPDRKYSQSASARTLDGAPFCGDNSCDTGETAASCSADCSNAACGNNVCEVTESPTSCPADCTTATTKISIVSSPIQQCDTITLSPIDTRGFEYSIVRDGQVIAKLPASQTSFTDKGLALHRNYTYYIRIPDPNPDPNLYIQSDSGPITAYTSCLPECSFGVKEKSVVQFGKTNLAWQCKYTDVADNGQGCVIENSKTGQKFTNLSGAGNLDVTVSETADYTLTCRNVDGSVPLQQKIEVFQPAIKEVKP